MKLLCTWGYRIALFSLLLYAAFAYWTGGPSSLLHSPAFFIPIAGMFLAFSAQADLLSEIRSGKTVNIKARAIDFTHWFLLTFMLVGRSMHGGISIWGFILNIVLLAIIGWQIGVGIKRQWSPTSSEKVCGAVMLVIAAMLGFSGGILRSLDQSISGWGWITETVTAIIATLILIWWISHDLRTIAKKASGYPRSFFLKVIFGNSLWIWVLVHLLTQHEGSETLLSNAGIAFNVIAGNLIYFFFYLAWEYYNARQQGSAAAKMRA